jgi:hypothetical protein
MTTEVLVPLLTPQFFSNQGQPLVGGQLFSYQAGTNTPQATYTDSTGGTPNSNPVILNARGEPPSGVWIPPNTAYKFVLEDASGKIIWTRDQVTSSQLITLFGGTDTGAANAYVLTFTASFSSYSTNPVIYWVPSNNNTGNSTLNVNGIGVVGIYNPNGTQLGANQIVAGQITGVIYQTNIANSGNSGFVLISVGNFTGATIGTFGPETAIASAVTTDLGSAAAHVVQITGTNTITSFGSSASLSAPIYIVRFVGALMLTYNSSSLILPASSNITTSPGDSLIAQYLGSGSWKVLAYNYYNGLTPNTKVKPADTIIASSTVLTADPDLQSNPLIVGRYSFEIYLVFDCATAGNGFQWTNSGTAVDSRGVMPALASGWVNGASYGPKSDTFYGTTITYATIGTTADSNQVLYKGTMLVGTAGTLGISWAQGTSGVSPTTLRAGSYLNTTLLNTGTSANNLTHQYTSGTGTETIPSGYNTLTIEVWPGGSGSGSGDLARPTPPLYAGGGGSGSGGYCRSVYVVTGSGGETMTYTVGAAGAAATIGNASTVVAGTFAMTTMTANPGGPGTNALGFTVGNGGIAGTATGGNIINSSGFPGGAGTQTSTGTLGGGSAGAAITGLYGTGDGGVTGSGGSPAGGKAGLSGLIIFYYSV